MYLPWTLTVRVGVFARVGRAYVPRWPLRPTTPGGGGEARAKFPELALRLGAPKISPNVRRNETKYAQIFRFVSFRFVRLCGTVFRFVSFFATPSRATIYTGTNTIRPCNRILFVAQPMQFDQSEGRIAGHDTECVMKRFGASTS